MEKITWTELRKVIADRINADEKEVATFMSALIPAITKALREDRQVRITNLGTFKLQSIAPRRSVNVATGEAFTLPGYEKLVFAPESSIKELLGNPKASPVEDDNTPLQKLGAQADEIVDILGDLGQGPKAAPTEPVVEEPKPAEPVAEIEPIIMTSTKEEKKEKKGRTWLVVGITVLIFALLLAAAFLFVGNRFISWVENLHNKATQTEQVEQTNPTQTTEVTETVEPTVTTENVEPQQPTQTKSNLPYPYEWKEFIGSEHLSEGSRLALLARKYYNETDMWVFIYEANKNTIQHPSDIPVGTKIRLPKIPRELRDLSTPETRQLVDELIVKYKAL